MTYVETFIVCFAVVWLWLTHWRFQALESRIQRLTELLSKTAKETDSTVEMKAIEIRLKVSDDDGNKLSSTLTWSAHEIEAFRVEEWLSQRGLVMAPKGKDFKVKQ